MKRSNNTSTRAGSKLARDHRIDAVADAVAHFQRAMMMDVNQSAQAMKEAEIEAEIEDFPEGLSAHLPRHAGQWGPRGYLVIQRRVVRGQPAGCRVAPIAHVASPLRPGHHHVDISAVAAILKD
jgi:hypothetical protein